MHCRALVEPVIRAGGADRLVGAGGGGIVSPFDLFWLTGVASGCKPKAVSLAR
jgi:hypothetical protein